MRLFQILSLGTELVDELFCLIMKPAYMRLCGWFLSFPVRPLSTTLPHFLVYSLTFLSSLTSWILVIVLNSIFRYFAVSPITFPPWRYANPLPFLPSLFHSVIYLYLLPPFPSPFVWLTCFLMLFVLNFYLLFVTFLTFFHHKFLPYFFYLCFDLSPSLPSFLLQQHIHSFLSFFLNEILPGFILLFTVASLIFVSFITFHSSSPHYLAPFVCLFPPSFHWLISPPSASPVILYCAHIYVYIYMLLF